MNEKTNKIFNIVLSLVFAIVFWVYVDDIQGNTITETYSNVPVEFVGATDTLPSRGLLLANGEDTTVTLVLRGPRSVISGLFKDEIHLQADLTGISNVGSYPITYKLIPPDDVSRNDITIERASVSAITVTVVKMFEKTVPVSAQVVGEVANGFIYMAEKLVVEPSELILRGREEVVDHVTSARVVVDLTNASSTVKTQFEYQLLDAAGNVLDSEGIDVSDKRVEVTAPLYMTKTLDLVVKLNEFPGSMSENVDLEINPKTIEVAGEPASLESKDEILLGEMDLNSFLSDTELMLDIKLPAECVNLSGVTAAEVTIDFKGLDTKTFPVTNITAIGLGEGQRFSRLTNSVDVLLRGPKDELEQLTGEEIRIVVDLTSFVSNGTYSVPAIVYVDGYQNVGAVGAYSVACKITN